MSFESTDDRSSQKNIQGQSEKTNKSQNQASATSRRAFLGHVTLFTTTATGVVTGVIGSPFSSGKRGDIVQAKDVGGRFKFDYAEFSQKAYDVRVFAAQQELDFGVPPHPTNGDEERYPNKIGSDSRGLPHDERGEVNLNAFGRSLGGIHWRSDLSASLALGEEIAISILRDERLGYNERFEGFTFTKFDGTTITV